MGVLPEHQNSEIGNKLGLKVLEICLKQNVNKIFWTFEPLESQLGHLYLNKWGALVSRYAQNYYQLKDDVNNKFPLDRFIVECTINSNRVIERINKRINARSVKEALNEYPVATEINFPDEKSILVQIPSNFHKLKIENSEKLFEFRNRTTLVFEEYINNRSYFIAEMFSEVINGERQNYYLMENRSYI